MPLKIEKTAESELNMTPMIDIVFQLILFFLFSLKFKSLDYRIETALPKDRGIQATPQLVTPIPSIKVSLFRRNAEDPKRAQTLIKVGSSEILLPTYEWTGSRKEDQTMEDDRDKRFAGITAKIRDLVKAAPEFKGEIDTPPPSGLQVPHADVIRILDAFLEAGITEVNFVGAPSPMPRGQGTPR